MSGRISEKDAVHPNTACFTEGLLNGYRWFDETGKEPLYPFGYGLSYTTFTQTLDSVEYDPNTDSYLVEVYAQTPYGDYEKQNRVEKSAVQFVGMGKTGTLEPGASETVTVEVDR